MRYEEIQKVISQEKNILVNSGQSKSGLNTLASFASTVNLRVLSGILEYDPGEYTFTALAGTPVAEVEAALAEHGQYLPFDPPFASKGATLGGTVAAGVNGPGRQRYGGVRDFLVGVKFVDGKGELVRGGGKVVKNAAGFDLPKLMVGSLGQLGALVELSFKVFPKPKSFMTLRSTQPSLAAAIDTLSKLATSVFDLEAVELYDNTLDLRLGGLEKSLPERLERLRRVVGGGEILTDDAQLWRDAREFSWLSANCALVKVPTTIHKIAGLDAALKNVSGNAPVRYSSSANVAWIAWAGELAQLDAILNGQGLSGLVVVGSPTATPLLGKRTGQAFFDKIKNALDPEGKFPKY